MAINKEIQPLNWLGLHLVEHYVFVYESKQSYYTFFEAGGRSWKKTSKVNPKAHVKTVAAKKKLDQCVLARYREEIESERLRVLFEDESHLPCGDLQGYVWGGIDARTELPIFNERERQTNCGAFDLWSNRLVVEAHTKGDTNETIVYLKFLQIQFSGRRLIVLWDGVSYHRSHKLQAFFAQVNFGLSL